jgi:hypothetical protein
MRSACTWGFRPSWLQNLVLPEKWRWNPTGVRAYPVGERHRSMPERLLNIEYRYRLPSTPVLAGEAVSLRPL